MRCKQNLVFLYKVYEKRTDVDRCTEALIYLIYKKGDSTNCENYREFALLDIACKVLEISIRSSVIEVTNRGLVEYQAGFRNKYHGSNFHFTANN